MFFWGGEKMIQNKKTKKYQLNLSMSALIDQEKYEKWLKNKARTHLKRDKKRGNISSTYESYRVAIHEAVINSNGKDAYTGENLDWSLINEYNNKDSKKYGRDYKKRFALLPTIDHVGDGKGKANFKICSWRTNDAKNDLSYEIFLELCNKIVNYSKN